MKEWEAKAKKLDCVNVRFKAKSLHEHEREFELQGKQGLLFNDD